MSERLIINDQKLAELSLNATLLQIAPGGEFEGKGPAKDCLQELQGERGNILVNQTKENFARTVLIQANRISELLARDGVEFSGHRLNFFGLKKEMIKIWENFTQLPPEFQQTHVNNLLAWAAGHKPYPGRPSYNKVK